MYLKFKSFFFCSASGVYFPYQELINPGIFGSSDDRKNKDLPKISETKNSTAEAIVENAKSAIAIIAVEILITERFFNGPRISLPELMQFEFFPAIIIISMLSEMNMGMAARKNHPEKAIPTPSVVEKKRRQVNLKFHEGLGVSA